MNDLEIVKEIIASRTKGPDNEFSSLSISAVLNLSQKDGLIIATNPKVKAIKVEDILFLYNKADKY